MAENTARAKPDKNSGASRSSSESSFDMDELRELMELVTEQGFTEFEFENETIRVRLSKAAAYVSAAQPAQTQLPLTGISPQPIMGGTATTETAPKAVETDEGIHKITSPIVGTFYRSPGPDKESYVNEGSKVTPESVVCIVEAMKLMNEIQAEVSGEVVKVYVENGQPVEFGQPLFGIRT
ncbi:MAG TPA: acetyl-CoA carboxylase biotin carboxyl carrier protein [Pyrinomonadaceae bacterium]|jgi:acetyl-CoA carboxylase biotin carboxyl carrier protein